MIGDDPSAKGGSGRPAGKSPWILDDNGDLGPVDQARVAPATEVDAERPPRSEWLVDAPEADAVAAQPKPADGPNREPDPATGKAAEHKLASLEARMVELEAELARRVSADEELMHSLDQHEEQFARETDSLRSVLEEVEQRLAQVERQLERQADEVERRAPPEAGAATGARSEPPGTRSINEISFEGLRQQGLSVTLAARLISFRDARGGLKSFDELAQVRGLSTEQRQELTRSLRL